MKKMIILSIVFFAMMNQCLVAQRVITGTITSSEDAQPIPGCTIRAKGFVDVGTISNLDGQYSLPVSEDATTLIFSFVGMKTLELPISGNVVNAVLQSEEISVSEVVVTAYGINRSSKSVGNSVSKTTGGKTVRIRGYRSVKNKNTSVNNNNTNDYVNSNQYMNPSIEQYGKIHENAFRPAENEPLSTFSIDVDRASYSNIRRFLTMGQKVPTDAVKIEEMINYFDYKYEQPAGENPYSIQSIYTECPWNNEHKLLHVALQGKTVAKDKLPPSNIVFLLDVSGSMDEANKLPLVKASMKLLVNNLRSIDQIAIVVYAGAAGLVLPSTAGNEKENILAAINNLQAGGSTAGGEGLELAYKTAADNYLNAGNNRIILCTDGDFNVGISDNGSIEDFITEKRNSGIYLTCLGFGMGNYKDNTIEILADKGNGNYAYIDNIQESNKTLVKEFSGTLFAIAKDVKIQVEFNPNVVQAYRLVGYENRLLNNEDFKDDKKDAGEMGGGHTVTAIYEIIPTGIKSDMVKDIDDLKYQKVTVNANTNEVATVKTRYKKPFSFRSIEYNKVIENNCIALNQSGENIRFSAAVAMFGMLLRNSEFKGNAQYANVIDLASSSKGNDEENYRAEFVQLVKSAELIYK